MSLPSFQEQLAMLAESRVERATHTARLAKIMGSTPPESKSHIKYLYLSGDIDALKDTGQRFWAVIPSKNDTRRRHLRIAYLTGWKSGLVNGLLAGIGIGMATCAAIIALGVYGSFEGLRWLL